MSVANRVATKLFTHRNEAQHSLEDSCLRILLSLCKSSSESLEHCLCVYSPITKLGLHGNLYLCNNLLTLYAKCFGPETARQLFDDMPHRDVVSWTGLVSAYSRTGKSSEAIELFGSMVVSGERPNEFTCSSVLRACSDSGDLSMAGQVHGYAVKLAFGSNTVLLSSLMDFYAKSGLALAARKVFGDIESGGDTVSWTTMISSLVQARKWRSALKHYAEMLRARIFPNEFTFVKLLVSPSDHGKLLHNHITVMGIRLSLALKTALVDMYSKSRRSDEAMKVLYLTAEHDVSLWTSLVSGFTSSLRVKEAVSALNEMKSFGVRPNGFTYSSLLKACSAVSSLELGKQIHSRAISAGLDDDVSVGNALVEMYTTCSSHGVDDSLRAFSEIALPNIISWTCLLSGLVERGFERESFEWFSCMRSRGEKPNSFTISAVLKGSSIVKSRRQTLKLHGLVIKSELGSDIAVGNSLVDAYAALGMVNESWRVLGSMKRRDVVTYTGLATRMNKSGQPDKALSLIKSMRNDDVKMDGFSLAGFLSASAAASSPETGKQLHCYAVKSGFRSFNSVSNSLIDFYWKIGSEIDGRRAFDEKSEPDIVSWNGLLSGLASNGLVREALSSFDDMRLSGFKPDSVTFSSLLFACSRGGLVDIGVDYFRSMTKTYGITPQLDHYVCLVDLLGRDGQLENAMEVIGQIPFEPHPLIYKTLLSSCKLHGNLLIGEDMFRRGVQLDPNDTSFYSLLANLYNDCGRAELAKKTRDLMRERGLVKNVGRSWIEIRERVHVFDAGDRSHPRMNEIIGKIVSLTSELRELGLTENTGTEGSAYHSEKLAVAFGLLNRPSNAPIHINKNMRICSECHDFIALVSGLVDTEITVRDGNRIHRFKRGECSCLKLPSNPSV